MELFIGFLFIFAGLALLVIYGVCSTADKSLDEGWNDHNDGNR